MLFAARSLRMLCLLITCTNYENSRSLQHQGLKSRQDGGSGGIYLGRAIFITSKFLSKIMHFWKRSKFQGEITWTAHPTAAISSHSGALWPFAALTIPKITLLVIKCEILKELISLTIARGHHILRKANSWYWFTTIVNCEFQMSSALTKWLGWPTQVFRTDSSLERNLR